VAALCDVSGGDSVQAVGVEGEEMTLPDLGWTTDGHVTDVHDGDTITVRVYRDFRVRLRDCWAPELEPIEQRRKWGVKNIPPGTGAAAHMHLKYLAEGYQVRLHVVGSPDGDFRDSTSMGRVVGLAWLLKDGTNLSEAMVAAGHATKEKPK
jgi:endonuclease YncB( thermonuclease family)